MEEKEKQQFNMNNNKDIFLLRAIDFANLADRNIKSNPPVGCVIVENDIIIGEGRHEKYGEAHAEVNAYKNAEMNGSVTISWFYHRPSLLGAWRIQD